MKRVHKENDPHNCTCHDCVYAALVRMGGPWRAEKTTKAQWFAAKAEPQEEK